MISLDISRAFDRVWHKVLLAKLPVLGLHYTLIKWISSFLSDRSIAIRVDGYLSNPHSINLGVPQGSVISPVLFILFINDLLSSTSFSIFSFADDTYLSSSFSSNPQHFAHSNISPYCNTSASILTNDFTNVEKWGSDNEVKFDEEKTKQVVISRKHHQDFPPVFMNSHKLDIPSSFIQFGLSISSNLTWKPNINSIAKHASEKLGFLSRARGYFSPHLLAIYKSQIHPSLEHCSHVWGGAPKSSLHLLDRVQSKAISLINNLNLTNSLQSLSHRRIVADLSIFYRYFHGHCSQKSRISFLIQQGVFKTPEALPIHTLSKLHYIIHELYLTNHLSFLELLNCATQCHPLLSLNPTICHLLNQTSTNLILSPSLLKLPHSLSFSFVGALL